MTPEEQEKLDEDLVKFSLRGNLDEARAAAAKGASAAYKYGLALSVAAQEGHDAIVSLLIAHGADVHAQQEEALRNAVKGGKGTTVALLLKEGADPNALEGEALIKAAARGDAGMARDLLVHKASPHYSDDHALRIAAYEGHADVVRLLLQFKADPFAMRGSALGLASGEKHAEVCEMLAEAMNEQRAAFLFDLSLQEKTSGWLRAPYGDTGESAFIRAVKMNNLDKVIEKMKQAGDTLSFADMHEMKDRNGHSLAELAAERGQIRKLFDPVFWRGDIEGLQATWNALSPTTRDRSGIDGGQFQALVADHRQKKLKDGASRYKLKPPGL